MKGYLVHKDGKTYRIKKNGEWDLRFKASRESAVFELEQNISKKKLDKAGGLITRKLFLTYPAKLVYRHSAWELLRPFLIPILVTIILGASYQAFQRYDNDPSRWPTVSYELLKGNE